MIWLLLVQLAGAAQWRLAAAYDSTSVGSRTEAEPRFVWLQRPGMLATCGPAKSPDGLGIFEAEAVNNGLTPSLVLVLEEMSDSPRLSTDDVRVSLRLEEHTVMLQPMVEPRQLAVHITGEGKSYAELVRTQLEVETCLEHKTGRGWTGGPDGERLKQAFLLRPPSGPGPSRKFFGGESDPVPALTGPPDACLVGGDRSLVDPGLATAATGRGEGSLSLVPTDVWGASLRLCDSMLETGGAKIDGTSTQLPLRLTGEEGAVPRPERHWSALDIELSFAEGDDAGPEEERVLVNVAFDGGEPREQHLFEQAEDGTFRLIDLLAQLPHQYPQVQDDESEYTVLIIPNWQIVEALRRLERGRPDDSLATSPVGVMDGVGMVLSHPELLSIQLSPAGGGDEERWPDLANVMEMGSVGQPYGYTVGLRAGRSPIVLPRRTPPTWQQTAGAQRSYEQAALLACFFVLLFVLFRGFRRISDLWTRIPEERAYYWPGLGGTVLSEAPNAEPEEGDE